MTILIRYSITVGLLIAVAVAIFRSIKTAPNAINVEASPIDESAKLRPFAQSLWKYHELCGVFPTTQEGLKTLHLLSVCGKPFPATLRILNKDSWGRPYLYESDGTKFRIGSQGADAQAGGTGSSADVWLTSDDDVGQTKTRN